MPLLRRLLSTSGGLLGGLVVDGLSRGLDCLGLGRAKLEHPIEDFFGLGGESIELLPPIGCLQLQDLREGASACQALG